MALPTPKISDVDASLIAQLEASLNQTIPLLPKSWIRVLTKVLSGVYILLYKYAGFIFLQLFVSKATIEEIEVFGRTLSPLIEWGRLIGVGDPLEATQAEFDITLTVENQIGQLDSGAQLINATNGVTYLTLTSVLLDAATVTASVIAAADQTGGDGSGAIGNLNVGDTIEFANTLPNVARSTTISVINVAAANEEAEDIYRQRVIDRFQKRLQGGALVDYEFWGEEVAGIINVYPYTGALPGHIDVYSEATEASSGSPDGIPIAAQLIAVFDAIELDVDGLASHRPANAFVNSFPITRTGFNVQVSGLVVDNPVSVQSTIDAAVVQYFLDRSPFVSGVTPLPRTDGITRNDLLTLITQVVVTAGGSFASATFSLTGVGGPLFTYILGLGEKAKLTTAVSFI